MCEFCEGQRGEQQKRINELREGLRTLAKGELPAAGDLNYHPAMTEEQREEFRLEVTIANAALLLSALRGESPTVVLGALAGTMMQAEAEAIMRREMYEEKIRRDAQFN
jgi:hypothetical protein